MTRRFHIDRPKAVLINLPESVWARITLHLWSEAEGRVPHGRYKAFFLARVNEYFEKLERKET